MNTQIINNQLISAKETISTVCQQTRSKLISAADVWFIQRQKRARIQRRYAL